MTYQGTVQNGVVVLAAGATLPEGTQVTVVPEVITPPDATAPPPPEYDPSMSIGEKLAEFSRWCGTFPTDLPTDLAKNHDHYLHGGPKKS